MSASDLAKRGVAAVGGTRGVAYGVVLLTITVIYLWLSYGYIPQNFSGASQQTTQLYTSVAFSATLAVTNGVYFLTQPKADAACCPKA